MINNEIILDSIHCYFGHFSVWHWLNLEWSISSILCKHGHCGFLWCTFDPELSILNRMPPVDSWLTMESGVRKSTRRAAAGKKKQGQVVWSIVKSQFQALVIIKQLYTLESFLFMGSMFVESHEFGGLWGCNFDGNKFGIIFKY